MATESWCGALFVLVVWSAVPAMAKETADQKIERLERELEELKQEMREMKEQKRAEAPAKTTAEAPPPAASEAPSTPRVQIGGYGSVRFEESSAKGTHPTFTFRRFVLTADAAVAPKLRAYLELEFERFHNLELERTAVSENGGLKVKQAVGGTDESEISLEQAWLQYDFLEALRFRTGAILVPLGRFNLNHDDNRWNLPRRPLVDRGAPVLPVKAAWDELGAGFNGELPVAESSVLGYQLYVVNGAALRPEVESTFQTQQGESSTRLFEAVFSPDTGTFGNDVKGAKAITGRLAYSPALGHEIAGSFYRGRYTPEFLPSESITAFAFDGISIAGPFELEGEYVHSDFGDVGRVARAFASRAIEKSTANEQSPSLALEMEFPLERLAETRHGYWLEARYRFWPEWLRETVFGRAFEAPELVAVVRGEQVWLDGLLEEVDFTGGQITDLKKSDRRLDRITVGGAYRPVPLVAFQLAYEFTHVDRGALSDVTNFLDSSDDKAHAVLLGAAFGF